VRAKRLLNFKDISLANCQVARFLFYCSLHNEVNLKCNDRVETTYLVYFFMQYLVKQVQLENMEVASVLMLIIAVGSAAMALLAILYLCRRDLGIAESLFWGALALFIPVLGPFLVIVTRPGKARPVKNRILR
jgi:hypothetical protein